MFRRRSRAGYIPITKQYQSLNHHTDYDNDEKDNTDNEHAEIDPPPPNEYTPNSSNSLTYTIYGYQHSKLRTTVYHIISILCLCIPYLIAHINTSFYVWLKYKKSDLDVCDIVFVTNNKGHASIVTIHLIHTTSNVIDYYQEILREIGNDHASTNQIRMFQFEHVRYIFNNRIEKFVRMQHFDEISTTHQLIYPNGNGISDNERAALMDLYGKNVIEIAIKSYWELFQTEIVNPFYIFQIFSLLLWGYDDYYYYAGCVFILSAISIYCSLRETKAQSITLHNMIENLKADSVEVLNASNQFEIINVDRLVPGDIIAIPIDGGSMACDAVLISGSCIVNESMLTGESVPVTKTPPTTSDAKFELMAQKRHILYAGTNILQTRYYGNERVLARVVRTGFNTAKGELIKSILFPRPIEFRFYEDSVRFVSSLFIMSTLGVIYTVYTYMQRGADLRTIIVHSLDIITIVVPPALPLAMTAGQIYSQSRLKEKNIFCISPQRINVCGKLKLVCFDKTGTLTDDGLTMDGCCECKNGSFRTRHTQSPEIFDERSKIVQNMATCHSLTTIHGQLNGDPLDIEMFRSIKWEYIEPGEEHTRFDNLAPTIVRPIRLNRTITPTTSPTSDGELTDIPYSIGIIKQHQFSSEAQCMSVIVRILGEKHMNVFVKGAPEKIHSLCQANTIPSDFFDVLHGYTSRGYRVIGLAHKKLSAKIKWKAIERMKRTEIETDLIFDGFLILMNCLKPETTNIIEELHAAKLRTVMITGDNLFTALSVAKDCRMIQPNEEVFIIKCDVVDLCDKPKLSIELSQDVGATDDARNLVPYNNNNDSNEQYRSKSTLLNMPADRYHFALDGTTWNLVQQYYPQLIPHIVVRGTIFARFRPEQKSQIVVCLKQYDYIVAMCGDGANDCGALKAAHIGVSLSKAEASVAAPFTSNEENITCIKHLTLEGRCALITSFGLFKYMIMYSLIQFICIIILYTYSSTLGNFQFLYVDLIITAALAFTMGRQGPSNKLVERRPSSSLLSMANVIPLIYQVILCAVIQILAMIYLIRQPWYSNRLATNTTAATGSDEFDHILCWENTVIFLVSCYQYLILGVVYSKGLPYRQPIYTNGLLILFVVLLTTFTTVLVIHPLGVFANIFEIKPYNDEHKFFRLTLLVFPLVHLLLSYTIELLIVDRQWYKRLIHTIARKKCPRNKFKRIEMNLTVNTISQLQQQFKC